MSRNRVNGWQRWVRQPQKVWLRKALFQVHLWSGISLGLYICFISVTGSVLVYRNELYVAAMPAPVDVPSGTDVGSAATPGIRLVSALIELHADLLAGPTGRNVNGIGGLAVVLVAVTGLSIWWPGIARWRRSLTLHAGARWKRFVWDLHSAMGFWCFGFILIFAVSGIYLSFPEAFHALADRLDPPTEENAGRRWVDRALYWLAFLHFGRINGIGIPCSGPGVCDQTVKAVWAVLGLVPAVMFCTGAIMWWNREVRGWLRRKRSAAHALRGEK